MMATAAYDVIDIVEKLASRADLARLRSLSSSEQTAVRAWSAFGIICNGGFKYFYEGSADTLATADAFDALGLPDAGEACRKSIALCNPANSNPHFDPLNHIIWELNDDDKLIHALALHLDKKEGQP